MKTILSITLGEHVGTWNVHYSDGSTELVDVWTDEMTEWYNRFYNGRKELP